MNMTTMSELDRGALMVSTLMEAHNRAFNKNNLQQTQSAVPEHILKRLRQRAGLNATDDSQDSDLVAQPPMQKLRNVIAWELCNPSLADDFLTWAKECGIELVDPR